MCDPKYNDAKIKVMLKQLWQAYQAALEAADTEKEMFDLLNEYTRTCIQVQRLNVAKRGLATLQKYHNDDEDDYDDDCD
jgi:vacuolar-type H+-ATPase subunit C/Vma6